MSGRCAKCCCFVCPPGRSRREGEHPGVVGSSTGRGPAQAMYAHTAGCEGVTRDERATGMPCEPSRPGLFVPVAVDGCACDIYPQWAGTRPGFLSFTLPQVEILMPTKKPRGAELTLEQDLANQVLHQRRLRIEHVNSSVKRCRIVKDRIRLWKEGVRDLVMELCCALHNFRVRLHPWQP